MLPFMEPKKIATMMLSKKGDMANVAPEKDMSEGENEGYKAVAQDILSAIESKSVHSLAMALKAFHELCYQEESEESEDGNKPTEGYEDQT